MTCHSKKTHTILRFFYIIPTIALLLTINKSWVGYSYWQDELGTVTKGGLNFSEMLSSILIDVHPPLYQIILKFWIILFGDDEQAVRSLSLIFSLLAFLYLFNWAKRFDPFSRWVAVTIFTTSFLFSFYAQEARNYSLLLLLSTVLTTQYASLDNNVSSKALLKIIISSFFLSLTHYFGLLLSGSVILLIIVKHIKDLRTVLLLICGGLLCLLWPTIHFINGLFATKSLRNAWITADSPLDTIRTFFQAMLPIQDGKLAIAVALVMVLLVGFAIFYKQSTKDTSPQMLMYSKLLSLTLVMIMVTTIIDTISPISTERNFIVLLPSIALITALTLRLLVQKSSKKVFIIISYFLVTSWGLFNIYFGYHLLVLKWQPQQNWKESAQYIIDHHANEFIFYLRTNDDEEIDRVFNFYIKKLSNNNLNAERIYIEQLSNIKKPAFLLLGMTNHSVANKAISTLNLRPADIFYPTQSLGGSTGVVKIR